jgi:glycosyltransferase involved in cell wall biosynthesis
VSGSAAPEITVALPAYNEEKNIARVVGDTRAALDRLGVPWEILVIDNCSRDGTRAVVEGLVRDDPRVRLIAHGENLLYSGSCRTAIREARGRHIAIMDSDGQCTAADVPRFRERLEGGASLVFGWRRERHDPLSRKLMSRVFNALGKAWLRFPFHDLNCGLRMFDRRFAAVAEIRHRINMSNPELFVRARRAGLPMEEVEVRHFERREGATSHDLHRSWRIFTEVNAYFRALHAELAAKP